MSKSAVEQAVISKLDSFGLTHSNGEYKFVNENDISTLKFFEQEKTVDSVSVASIAEIATEYDSTGLPEAHDEYVAKLNSRAAYGAFSLRKSKLCLKAQYSIYVDEPATDLAAFLILQTYQNQYAFGYAESRCHISEKLFYDARSYMAAPIQWKEAVTEREFQESAAFFKEKGYFCTAGTGGISLEVQLHGNVPSALFGKSAETALLHVSTDIMHPIAGVGYMTTIALPIDPSARDIVAVVRLLNDLELSQDDFVPRLGAWGIRANGKQLVYSYFLPTDSRFGSLHQILMNWNIMRTTWLRDKYWIPHKGILLEGERLQRSADQ